MARKLRIIADNTYHHIIQRGNNRQKVFKDNSDYKYFKLLIIKYLKKYDCQIFHYCLLSNHLHMLIHIQKGSNMPKFLQGVNLSYSLYHKKKYKFTGSLWQGRYKSFLIDGDKYLLECARYIERNPLRADIVEDISNYPYSSYNYYATEEDDAIITENIIYKELGDNAAERQRNYIDYINQDRLYENLIDKALEMCPPRT
jgi:putative transposase